MGAFGRWVFLDGLSNKSNCLSDFHHPDVEAAPVVTKNGLSRSIRERCHRNIEVKAFVHLCVDRVAISTKIPVDAAAAQNGPRAAKIDGIFPAKDA